MNYIPYIILFMHSFLSNYVYFFTPLKMLEKDYRFKDLPETHKQCLVYLHQQSEIPNVIPLKLNKIKKFESLFLKINSIPTDELKQSVISISNYLQDLKKTVNSDAIIEEVENKLVFLNNQIDFYCMSLDNPIFFDELKQVYLMLSGRLLEIKTKNKQKNI